MVIGVLQFEVVIPDASSIKDKRRVVHSLRDRLHREHMVSIAEVGDPDVAGLARLAIACVARDGARAGEVLDKVSAKLRANGDGEVGPIHRQILRGVDFESEGVTIDEGRLASEMIERAVREDGP